MKYGKKKCTDAVQHLVDLTFLVSALLVFPLFNRQALHLALIVGGSGNTVRNKKSSIDNKPLRVGPDFYEICEWVC